MPAETPGANARDKAVARSWRRSDCCDPGPSASLGLASTYSLPMQTISCTRHWSSGTQQEVPGKANTSSKVAEGASLHLTMALVPGVCASKCPARLSSCDGYPHSKYQQVDQKLVGVDRARLLTNYDNTVLLKDWPGTTISSRTPMNVCVKLGARHFDCL